MAQDPPEASSRHGEEQDAPRRVAASTGDLSDAVIQTLAEESPDAIVVVDVQGRLAWGNRQAEQLFGYGRAELLGQEVELLLPEGVQKAHLAHRAAYMENPRTRPMGVGLDLKARRRDGTTCPVEISLTPLSTDSGDMVIATVRDISERQTITGEQAALRRVATLVARGVPPEDTFAAVTAEAGRVLDADFTSLARYDPDGRVTLLAAWTGTGDPWPVPVGSRWDLGGGNLSTLVSRTRQPARLDGFGDDIGLWAADVLTLGVHSAVAVPISVEGRLWGLISVFSNHEQPLPAGTEARLAGFTQLVATAIANAQARVELRGFAEEQAALRRVATLVARGTPPEEVFAAVTAEAGRVLGVDFTTMSRYHPDGAVTVVGAWSGTDIPVIFPAGTRLSAGGPNLHTQVFQTGQPARLDTIAGDLGPALAPALAAGIRTAVGVPISVEGRLWGVMNASSTAEEPLSADTEARLAGFTELVATAIANAEARAALTASRARIVATADATRRHIERDLHDGAQQRLVSLLLQLRAAQATVAPDAGELAGQLDDVATGLGEAVDELREIARGIHPAALAEGGLRPALKVLARRSAVPVRLDARVDRQLPEQVELAAYYVVSETLTNAARHAAASEVDVEVEADQGVLRIEVRDDGRGGATFAHGSGLVGLRDRVEALGGQLSLRSQPGAGTTVSIAVSLDDGGETRPRT